VLHPGSAYAQRGGHEKQRPQIPAVLQGVFKAAKELAYSGTRVVEYMRGSEKSKHTEYVLTDGRKSRVWFPSDSPFAGQVIVEDRARRLHYFPGKNEIYVLPARRDMALRRLSESIFRGGGNMRLQVSEGESVAGRATKVLAFSDKNGNVQQRLWIDSDNSHLLKRELYDPVGAKIGSYEFTSVDYSPKVEAGIFEINRKGAKVITPELQVRKLAQANGLAALIIPASLGYRLDSVRMMKLGSEPVLHQLYLSARGRLSFFQVKGTLDPERFRTRTGPQISVRTWQRDGRSFALLGSVPADELQRIAKALGG